MLLIGENHNLVEHQKLLSEWVLSLHSEGYRQLLVECYQLFDWIITDYVNGEEEDEWHDLISLADELIKSTEQ